MLGTGENASGISFVKTLRDVLHHSPPHTDSWEELLLYIKTMVGGYLSAYGIRCCWECELFRSQEYVQRWLCPIIVSAYE